VGARNAQAAANAKAADTTFPDQVQEIDAIGRIVTDHLDDNLVMEIMEFLSGYSNYNYLEPVQFHPAKA